MNKQRRKEISDCILDLGRIVDELEDIAEEEQLEDDSIMLSLIENVNDAIDSLNSII